MGMGESHFPKRAGSPCLCLGEEKGWPVPTRECLARVKECGKDQRWIASWQSLDWEMCSEILCPLSAEEA